MLSRSKTLKAQQVAIADMREKPVDFYNVTAQASTLAPKIILPTQVILQKFLFL